MLNKIKNFGEVFTPDFIVKDMLDFIGYNGCKILQKRIIDNSCGDGAFLCEIAKRYIKESLKVNKNKKTIESELRTFIYGIEINKENYKKCIENLNNIAKQFELNIKWNIICEDTLTINEFNGKMDFVVGNPPYVRIHNLGKNFNKVKNFDFAKNGMCDLFIVFYEIGLKMLNKQGRLAYISPNSLFSSQAGKTLRKFIRLNQNLYKIYDLGHYQPFNITSYTAILCFDNNRNNDFIEYYKYNENGANFIKNINYN